MWLVSSLDAATAWTKMNAWLAATKSRPAALCGQILAQWSWVRFHWDFYDLSRWHYVAMVYSWSDMWPFLRKSKRLILLEDAMTRSPATSLPIASPYPSGPLKWPVPPRTASWLRLGSAWKLPSSVRDLFFFGLYRSQQGNIGKQWENMGRVKPPSTVIWGSFADDPLTSTVVTKPLSWQPRRSWIFAYASIQRVSLVEEFVSDGLWIWFGRSLPTHIGIWL